MEEFPVTLFLCSEWGGRKIPITFEESLLEFLFLGDYIAGF